MNIIRVKNILLMAAFAIVAASCQKNGPQDGELYGDSIVRFAPSVVNITEAIDTKGTLINEDGPGSIAFDTSKSFFVRAWDNATSANNIIPGGEGYQEVKMKGSQWNTVYTKEGKEYAKEYIWKKNEIKTFYAYANLPASGATVINPDATGQTLSYTTVPATASAQTDILLGFYTGKGETGSPAKQTGTAGIVFSHPLTAVQFVYGDIADNLAIKSISLAKVAGTGTAKMGANGTISWTSVGTLDYTVSQTNDSGLSVDSTTKLIGEPFIIIPQEVATDNVIVNVTFKNNVTASVTISSGQWETGKNYIYKLKYVVLPMESELSVTLVDWTNLLSKDGDEIFDVTFGTKSTE